ncbi:hypothetical protein SGLAM104S_08480 [Streptomyces glaucescens]
MPILLDAHYEYPPIWTLRQSLYHLRDARKIGHRKLQCRDSRFIKKLQEIARADYQKANWACKVSRPEDPSILGQEHVHATFDRFVYKNSVMAVRECIDEALAC